jgi:hypothetical protein
MVMTKAEILRLRLRERESARGNADLVHALDELERTRAALDEALDHLEYCRIYEIDEPQGQRISTTQWVAKRRKAFDLERS